MPDSTDKPIEATSFSYGPSGMYIIDKRLEFASVRVALTHAEVSRLVELYIANSQPWDYAG